MILVFGGTTEGRVAVETLEEAGSPYYYSTRGDEQEVALHHGTRLQGAMNEEDIVSFCHRHDIRLLVDAAHPFAENLHRTVASAAACLSLPIIRLERIYPPRDVDIVWCRDYDDAIGRIRRSGLHSILALTGVQTIGRLRPLWEASDMECHFRILNRDSSRQLAARLGFPADHLCYYRAGEEEDQLLLSHLRPQAIILKESGVSGGFSHKVDAARRLGIRIFAICRPHLSAGFCVVNGRHGLRRAVERLLPPFYPLHSGLTTGTCATAAAIAAVMDLLHPEQPRPAEVPVLFPDGETIPVEVVPRTVCGKAAVIKRSGDDPDITNGIRICASAAWQPAADTAVVICGGRGIGRVTLPGLGLPIGAPAINRGPQQMIQENIGKLLVDNEIDMDGRSLCITLSIPDGEVLAARTFNPRLGIVGGISVIGTSGIIKPFSSEAFVDSIRKSLEVALATGAPRVVLNSGAKSEGFLRGCYPDLPVQAFVHYGNYIGATLQAAAALRIPRITLGVMIGKAVKLAEGHLDTHSREVTMNTGFVCHLAEDICSPSSIEAIRHIRLARELWQLLPSHEWQAFAQRLLHECMRHCRPLYPDGDLTLLLLGEQGETVSLHTTP